MTDSLKPCPFCGAGKTDIHPNGRMWTGQRLSEPTSVSIRHWCEDVPGQPHRMIERVGRDEASAIEAWNRRALAAPPVAPGLMTAERHFALREAHAIGASDAYFKVWPIHDNDAGRMLFERGFVRGFDSHARIIEREAAPGAPDAPQSHPSLCDNPRGCGCQAPSKPHPSCKTPEGCRESGCLGWCDEHKPEVATRCEGCAALRDQLRDEVENSAMCRLVSDLVKRDAHRFRKLLMQHKHWLGVFRCDPDGAPSDSLSHVELTALLDAMDGPELDF